MVLITVATGANLSQRSHIVAGGAHIGLEPTGFRELIIIFSQRNKIINKRTITMVTSGKLTVGP
jgi:hypothetical protein